MTNPVLKKLEEWINSSDDCACIDKSYEEFDNCCGKKYGITQEMIWHALFGGAEIKNSGPRFKDLSPEKQKEILDTIG